MIKYSVDQPDWVAAIETLEVDTSEKLAMVAEGVGAETIAFLVSLTDEMRPPAESGERTISFVTRSKKLGGKVFPKLGRNTAVARFVVDKGKEYRSTGPRRAHPGHWADITGQLAASYAYTVTRNGRTEIILTLSNSAEYAKHLEGKHGYWVLSGVTDKGGPVEQALRRALWQYSSGWELRRG